MITLNHRKADILSQLWNQNISVLVANLAQMAEDLEKAQTRIAELEKEISDLKAKAPGTPV